MTAREKKLVGIGLAIGLAIAIAAVAALRFVPAESVQAQAGHSHAAMPAPAADAQPSGVHLSSEEQNAAGLQTAEVTRQTIGGGFDTVGQVAEAETQLATVSARVGGRIDRLLVNFTGQNVRRGETVALIYSPELNSAAEEYRLAVESRKQLSAANADAIAGANDLVASSRKRLELLGATEQQIAGIERSSQTTMDLPIFSDASGVVTERKVTQGQYVNAGDTLFTLADLGTVWVKADVYEADLPRVHMGQAVEITADALPNAKLRGRVGFVDVGINPQTRTASVRVQVANPGLRLRPGMYARAHFVAGENPVLAVPRSAVVDNGTRKLVYVSRGNGDYEAREVKLGAPTDDAYPVISGLREGERVVVNGAFLLDSQTRLTGGMSGMFGGSKEFEKHSSSASAYKLQLEQPTEPRAAAENRVVVTLADASGKAVADAQVKVTFVMPAMPSMNMPEMRASADLQWDGNAYVGKITPPMAGPYSVTVEASRAGQTLAESHARLNAK